MSSSKSPEVKEQQTALDAEKKTGSPSRRERKGDRRISDKLQPLLDRIIGILSANSPRTEFYTITESIRKTLDCESLRIYGMDRRRRQLFSRNFISKDLPELRLDEFNPSLPAHVVKTRKSLYIADVQKQKASVKIQGHDLDQLPDPVLKKPITSAIVLPLSFNGRLVGVLEIINSLKPGGFASRDYEFSLEVGQKLAAVLDNLEWADAEEIHQDLISIFKEGGALEQLLEKLKPKLQALFRVKDVLFFHYDPKRHSMSVPQWKSLGLNSKIRLPLEGKHFLDKVVDQKVRIHIPEVNGQNVAQKGCPNVPFDPEWDQALGIETKSVMAVPVLFEDRVVGALQMTNRRGDQDYAAREISYLDQIAHMLGNAVVSQIPLGDLGIGKFNYLVENGIISNDELAQVITKSRTTKTDIETLLEKELNLSREAIGKSLEEYYGMPYYGYQDAIFLDKDILQGLNRNYLAKNLWVPIDIEENRVWILINEPENKDKVLSVKMTFPKKEIQFRVGLKADILDFLNLSFVSTGEEPSHTQPDMSQIMEDLSSAEESELGSLQEEEDFSAINESDSSIVRFVNKMIIDAYEVGASDIHIEPGRDREDLLVRFRVDGDCRTYQKVPRIYKQAMVSRIKVMALLDISERRLPQDGKIRVRYRQKTIDLRVATGPTVSGNEDVVLRLLRSTKPLELEQLQLTESNFERVQSKIKSPHGLILVVGPTGSGKTTTLHSFLNTLNTPNKKIWTAEDPVEISQPGIRQLQVNSKIGLTFAQAFRFFLRADPDIIMIGEMRDLETMNIALEASLSGHMVLSTLHTNSATETVNRLLMMGLDPYMFADALLMIVAQRLVKILCTQCAETYSPDQQELDILIDQFGRDSFAQICGNLAPDLKLRKAVGCSHCDDTGYRGRMGIHEVLLCSEDIRSLIVQRTPLDRFRKAAMSEGMLTLKQDGILKILQGHSDLKQVLAVCGG